MTLKLHLKLSEYKESAVLEEKHNLLHSVKLKITKQKE